MNIGILLKFEVIQRAQLSSESHFIL